MLELNNRILASPLRRDHDRRRRRDERALRVVDYDFLLIGPTSLLLGLIIGLIVGLVLAVINGGTLGPGLMFLSVAGVSSALLGVGYLLVGAGKLVLRRSDAVFESDLNNATLSCIYPTLFSALQRLQTNFNRLSPEARDAYGDVWLTAVKLAQSVPKDHSIRSLELGREVMRKLIERNNSIADLVQVEYGVQVREAKAWAKEQVAQLGEEDLPTLEKLSKRDAVEV